MSNTTKRFCRSIEYFDRGLENVIRIATDDYPRCATKIEHVEGSTYDVYFNQEDMDTATKQNPEVFRMHNCIDDMYVLRIHNVERATFAEVSYKEVEI